MLVLLMGGVRNVGRSDAFMWHDKRSRCREDWYFRSSSIKVFL